MSKYTRTQLAEAVVGAAMAFVDHDGDLANLEQAVKALRACEAEDQAAEDKRVADLAAYRAKCDEAKAHNDALRKDYGKDLAARIRAASRHLTAFELGGARSGSVRSHSVGRIVAGLLGLPDYDQHAPLQRGHVPVAEEVERALCKLRTRWSSAHEKFGPITLEDVRDAQARLPAAVAFEKACTKLREDPTRRHTSGSDYNKWREAHDLVEGLERLIAAGALLTAAADVSDEVSA